MFAGTPHAAVPSLRGLLDSSHEVLAVLTRPDARSGRGRRLQPSPVAEVARAAGVPVLRPTRADDPEWLEALRDLGPDACPVVAYGQLLRQPVLDVPTHGWVNLHFSLLPAWRGAAPVQHAVLAGDEVTGASTFRLEAGMDTGPVYGTLTEPIRTRDTSGDLLERLAEAGAGLLLATLDAIESGAAHPAPQPADGVSLAPKITAEDARVRWGEPAFAVDRRIRACTPAPGAWTTLRGDRLGLGPVEPDPEVTGLSAGQVLVSKRAVHIGTATHAVRLGEVRPVGRKAMPAADWARGARLGEDDDSKGLIAQ